MHKQRRSL